MTAHDEADRLYTFDKWIGIGVVTFLVALIGVLIGFFCLPIHWSWKLLILSILGGAIGIIICMEAEDWYYKR